MVLHRLHPMERLLFNIHINAPRRSVGSVLWDGPSVARWTESIRPGVRVVSDRQIGSRVHFLSGEKDGIYAIIDRKEEPAYMGFTHFGAVVDGHELPVDEDQCEWSGAREAYALVDNLGGTDLLVMLDIDDVEVSDFTQLVRSSLRIVKVLAERERAPFFAYDQASFLRPVH